MPFIGRLGNAPAKTFLRRYTPLYMYAIPVVAPSSVFHSRLLEKVNRFAGRLIENDYKSPYDELLHKLGWKSMSRHIFERQLILSWKYVRRQRFLPEGVLSAWEISSRLRRGWGRHDQMVSIDDGIFCGNRSGRIDRKTQGNCPFYRCILLWNLLSPEIVDMELNNFKVAVRDLTLFNYMAERAPNLVKKGNIE